MCFLEICNTKMKIRKGNEDYKDNCYDINESVDEKGPIFTFDFEITDKDE